MANGHGRFYEGKYASFVAARDAICIYIVVPLLGVQNTSVLAISTPLDSDNYYSKITQLKDENKRPLFKSISS